MVKFQVLFQDRNGVPLEQWMQTQDWKSTRRRMFYVIRANMDHNEITKIGISGETQGRPESRLKEYISFYGYNTPKNPCSGCKVYMICYTGYNSQVEKKASAIWKLEKRVKQFIKPENKSIRRGTERTRKTFRQLFDFIMAQQDKVFDVPAIPREGLRNR